MNLDLSGAGAATTNPFVILSNPEIAILHIELMVTILVTNHRLTVIMLLPCTHHSGSIEVFCDTYYIMAGHAIVVVKDITLLFYHGNAVILTLW